MALLEALSVRCHGGKTYANLFLRIFSRHSGTGCNAKGKVVPVHIIKAHGDWM